MKRIKTYKMFESKNMDEYYIRINQDDMDWDTIYFDFFTENDLLAIWDLISKEDIDYEVQNQPRTNKPNYRLDINRDDRHVSVRALRDEWFLVELVDSSEFPRHTLFYKCDQLEGLLECLKEILYID
jgi:hypothetical protein